MLPESRFDELPLPSTSHTSNEILPALSTGITKADTLEPFLIPLSEGIGTVRSVPALLMTRIALTSPPASAKPTVALTTTVPPAA